MSTRLEYLKPKLLNDEKIRSWFTLKNENFFDGQQSIKGLNLGLNTLEPFEVIEKNLSVLADEIGTEAGQIAYAKQVHGSDILEVNRGGQYEGIDGLITSRSGIALAIQVADCAAVLLADSFEKIISAVHAGWRGAAAGIVPKAINRMISNGASPDNIKAYISPCISLNNFEVGEEVARQFPEEFVDRVSFKKPHINLKGFIIQQMKDKGLLSNHIECDENCTISDSELFYSYRREGKKSGRMMGVIKIEA